MNTVALRSKVAGTLAAAPARSAVRRLRKAAIRLGLTFSIAAGLAGAAAAALEFWDSSI